MTEAPLQAEPPQSADNKQQKQIPPIAIAFIVIAGIIFMIVALDSIFTSTDHQEQNNSTVTTVSPSTTDQSPSRAAPSATFAPLHFTSSGRLPTKFHGMQLGMSVAEAMAEDPDLKSCLGGPTADQSATPCTLSGDASDGFSLIPVFSQGRLVEIDSEVRNIRPEDAALFNTNTLNQLGKPDVNVYEGPSTDAWVWIDGDVRIRYTNSGNDNTFIGRSGPRTVDITLTVYPAMMAMILADKNSKSFASKTEALMLEQDWNASPLDLRTLQRDVSGLELSMTPWQVRSTLPGIEINTISEDEAIGELKTAKVDTSVSFWDGRAMAISKFWYDVPTDQLPQIRAKLLKDNGTPSACLPPILPGAPEIFTWEDNETQIDFYLKLKGKGERPEVDAWFTDRRLASLKAAAEAAANPPKFEAAPETHSFF
jgi:hypothetical protein